MKPRTASRLAWSVGIASISLMAGQLALMFIDRGVTFSAETIFPTRWTLGNVVNVAVTMAVPVIGIVLASRRPDNPIGWLFLAAGFGQSVSGFGASYGIHALVGDPGSLPAGRALVWVSNCLGPVTLGIIPFIFLLFPTGHLPSARWRPVARFVGGAFALSAITALVYATGAWNHPFRESSSALAFFLGVMPILVTFGVSVAALVARFRRSVGDERLQLRWFVTGAVLLVVTLMATIFFSSPVLESLQILASVFFFTAIGIAVLKYRLYDIDVVISKTVIYGVLAAFFTLVYAAVVVGIGTAVGSARNPFLTLLAAAVIALAFNPVRTRATRLANRIVYGKRASPYEVLSDFAGHIAGTYSFEDILPRMAEIVANGTGAERTVVWLRVGDELRGEAASDGVLDMAALRIEGEAVPAPTPGERAVPVSDHGELLGMISIRMPRGEALTATGERLVSDVASQAGLVLRNVRLIEELRTSRQRIVAAQDAAARRLERNIHDGAQQQLVAIAVKQRLVESLVRKDPDKAEGLLSQLQAETAEALDNLRDLARGIYPSLLADQGLTAALEAQARRSAVPVTVRSEGIGRYAQESEAAVYFCTLEALQNVAKYANARSARVELAERDGSLLFTVRDDGVGFDAKVKGHGTGMQGMADRLAALGGELRVTSAPDLGTLIEGRVPIARPARPATP
jgi:signal transduction histidine kinase